MRDKILRMEELKEQIEKLTQQYNKLEQKERIKEGKYVIVRTYSAGVFAGTLISKVGKEVILKNARRLWYWEGASSLSQLAMEGTSKPEKCKFPVEVTRVVLTEAIEVLDVTEKARKSIVGVPIWSQ